VDTIENQGNPEVMEWLTVSTLSIVVVGASGDLAKKKTFPSLLNLYDDNLLPKHTRIWGFARSDMSDEELRDRLRPHLTGDHSKEVVDRFLARCVYRSGTSYGDQDAFTKINQDMEEYERDHQDVKHYNRLFYFAIPPNVFADTALAIKKTSMQDESKGFTRLIVEKPFGRDLESFEKLNKTLAEHFTEDHMFRIDHYLGKEMVQNLTVLRFSNIWFERVWNADNIQCVILTFKEPFGTDGRGGYFDKYGIIRDILQNHLLQVLTLLAMETPVKLEGPGASRAIRNAKVAVLNAIPPVQIEDVVLGQYEGYADDPTIENKDTNTPTYATIKLSINTPRWYGVPFILKAGKATNERKAEMRIQFKDPPAASFLFEGEGENYCPRNELVMRMQPDEAVYMKTNVKSPGFTAKPIQSELEVNYDTRFFDHQKEANPDAYTRLILDVLQGKHAAFVRDDELRRAWEIFTPILKKIENENIRPVIYKQGSRGPIESDNFIMEKAGYIRNEDYVFHEGGVARKTEGTNTMPVSQTVPQISIPDDELCDIGIFGQSVMGANLSLNIAESGFRVVVGNRTQKKVEATVQRAKDEGNLPLVGSDGPEHFVSQLKKPRKVIILVQAGTAVDDTISSLAKYLEPGDILIDGGNEWFPNSIRRGEFLEPKNIHFLGMGISGGEEGARKGPSLMPGGPKDAYDLVEPILSKCAAYVDEAGSCVGYVGPIGAGNYVKMVHNGIEYGDMQLIAEVYDTMKSTLGMSNLEIADVFDEWNKSELESYLIEITATILRKKDDETGCGYVIDYILDKTGMKGTGRWTIQEGAERGVAISTLAAALDARMLSGLKEEREVASKVLDEPSMQSTDKTQVVADLRAALYASKVCSYAQGLSLIKAASDEYQWDVDLSECARLWMGGCIIRAKLLGSIREAYSKNSNLSNLLVDAGFASALNERSVAWRRLIALCVTSGVTCSALCNSLSYFDTYRRARLPANLTQAQRDFFGGHTYERTDKDGRFHTAWTDAHKDIGDASQRTSGENVQI
jgi:6-phosphogluconate dehydrogenase